MAVAPPMGFPSNSERRTGSDASTCENEHGDTIEGQVGEIIVHGPAKTIVNIPSVRPSVAIRFQDHLSVNVADCTIIMMYCIPSTGSPQRPLEDPFVMLVPASDQTSFNCGLSQMQAWFENYC